MGDHGRIPKKAALSCAAFLGVSCSAGFRDDAMLTSYPAMACRRKD